MKSYRDLIVWQKAMRLITLIYKQAENFPIEERFCLSAQLTKSAVSVPSNIAEGYGRSYRKEYCRFLQIARGSLFEAQTQLEIAVNLSFLNSDNTEEIMNIAVEVEKMLNALIKKLAS